MNDMWKHYKTNKPKYDRRFNYYQTGNNFIRVTKLWWKPIEWLGNTYWLRYGVDKVMNLFILPCEWSLKRKWNYWGGGGQVNWWIRKHITFN